MAAAPYPVPQDPSPLARIATLEVGRIDVGRAAVFYSIDLADGDSVEAGAREVAMRLGAAAEFFAGELGADFRYNLALLSPRHWNRVGGGRHPLPWSSQRDRLVVMPVHSDMSLLLPTGQDSARTKKVLDIISYHQLGHVVSAAFLYPAGPGDPMSVRWFDELLASYLAYWYMVENEPALAKFMQELAREVVSGTEPRFSGLDEFDEYYDGYLESPQGANTLGWYQNAFNLRAAELYADSGPAFFQRVRRELPWVRVENWTTDELLVELEDIAPGFRAWALEMEERAERRF